MREEAAFLGFQVAAIPLDRATVIVDRRALFPPSPGHRAVRIHPVPHLDAAVAILEPHGARLQGVAVAGERATAGGLADRLAALGVSCTSARPASFNRRARGAWRNGGSTWLPR